MGEVQQPIVTPATCMRRVQEVVSDNERPPAIEHHLRTNYLQKSERLTSNFDGDKDQPTDP